MTPNTTKHLIFNHKSWKKNTLLELFKNKRKRKGFINQNLRDYYFDEIKKRSSIKVKALDQIVDFSEEVRFQNFYSRNGNVSPLELLVIGSLIAHFKPKRILEIGTFDGNTTLQMALNCPSDGVVHTLDLPPGDVMTAQPVLDSDLKFIQDLKKEERKFLSSSVSHRVIQHFGDSTSFDFSLFTREGPLDFIFIDGGHSLECVKSDTENALKILRKGGLLLWHDFTPHFGGVFEYLNSLSKELPLINIDQTNLVLLENLGF